MKIKAYAKINLSLDLTGRLTDGYHAIETVMQSVSLYDTVTVDIAGTDIELGCSVPGIPCDGRNTAYKAALYFREAACIKDGIRIFIDKKIPSEAGLAGGSADAAAVLAALSTLYPGRVTEADTLDMALRVGADVPFCLTGGTRYCTHKGERMEKLPDFHAQVLLAKPDRGVSTGAAFGRFDTASSLVHPDTAKVLADHRRGLGEEAAAASLNIFEQLTDIPEGEAVKKLMLASGAYYASLSGSGSCYFGLFRDRADCLAAAERMKELVPFVSVCETVACGTRLFEN